MPSSALHILKLIISLAEKEKQTLDYAGFGAMSNVLEEPITQRYLDDLYRDIKNKIKNNDFISRKSVYRLDIIARYLDYKDFHSFSVQCEKEFSEVLQACIGNWWSYVRASTGGYILRAPVRIFLDENRHRIMMELVGSERLFLGEIIEKGGSMFGFLSSDTAKHLSIVFKLGHSKNIQVMQGVFCGVSSAGNPISGKEILVKEEWLPFENMQWKRLSVDNKEVDETIRNYFADHEKCCLQIKEVYGFDLETLIN